MILESFSVIAVLSCLLRYSDDKGVKCSSDAFNADEEYKRKQLQGAEDDNSMRGLRWDGAVLRKVVTPGAKNFYKAVTLSCDYAFQ